MKATRIIKRCKIVNAGDNDCLATFQIAYVAVGLTIWQGA
jgi:hypothetical protein